MDLYEIIPKDTMDAIEESIQRKRGSQTPIEPSEMPSAIDTIPSSVDGTDVPVGGIYFTKPDSNGNPTECHIIGYAPNKEYVWSDMLKYFKYLSKISFVNCKNISSMGKQTFSECTALTTINLPNSLTSIDSYAFYVCTSLTTVNLPNSLTSIGSYAFRECTSLTTVNLPNSLASIADDAFYVCTSLTDVTIESGFNCNCLNLSASNRYTTEAIVSWLEALADRTGQTAYKLTIGKTNLNKLTAEQKAIATNKNWTLA